MSGESIGWVFRHSPLTTPGEFAVHLALGDSANDQNDWELWSSVGRIAAKARVSRATAQRALRRLVELDLLEVVEERVGQSTRYRLLMPDLARDEAPPVASRATPLSRDDAGGVASRATLSNERERKRERKRERNARTRELTLLGDDEFHPAPTFDDFWSTYPRRVAKPDAQRAWHKAIKRASPATIVDGAARYRDDPNRDQGYTAHPATWLNRDGWADEALPARGRTRRGPNADALDHARRIADRLNQRRNDDARRSDPSAHSDHRGMAEPADDRRAGRAVDAQTVGHGPRPRA